MIKRMGILCGLALLFGGVTIDAIVSTPAAQTVSPAIPPMPLKQALTEFAQREHLQLVYVSQIAAGIRTQGAAAGLSPQETLQQLLRGTGLQFRFLNANTVTISPVPAPAASKSPSGKKKTPTETGRKEPPVQLAQVTVTGSRIRGAPPASPVIDISQEQMIEAGQTNLGEVIRSIPQNFSGGQNPGVVSGTVNFDNQNFTGGSALNLRGLGPDATLTLLNGHRLSYDGVTQAVDISVIPLAAVDRIEIVAAGASAIYGSDAVAGVANVMLKRDYDGVSATARFGHATDGGDIQRQYSFVTGTTWDTGGFIATLNSEDDSSIKADQRDYTSYMPPPYSSLLPTHTSRAALFSVHQEVGPIAIFSLDALAQNRTSKQIIVYGVPPYQTVYEVSLNAANYAIAPRLAFKLHANWDLSINALYGSDHSTQDSKTSVQVTKVCYCNSVSSLEVDANGPLFSFPGGDVRVALGGGYRENTTDNNIVGGAEAQRRSFYAFGEMFLPLVSPEQNIPFAHELSLSGAVRHESYNDFGSVTTPKIGLIYSPTVDIDLKASWGRSFKTPTLVQEYQLDSVYLFPIAILGGKGYPSAATALFAQGGNPSLKPERATTWTTTLSLHPRNIDGFQADLSYFHINYRDRIVQPVTPATAAFIDPIFLEFIDFDPTPAQQQEVIDSAAAGLINFSGTGYDPTNVVAVVNDTYTNTAFQKIHGIDLSTSYLFDLRVGSLMLNEHATWLTSQQQTSVLAPTFDLAGTVYNPPHFRSRLGATWKYDPLTLSAFYNYIGGVIDTQHPSRTKGDSMQTFDLTALYHFRRRFDLLLSVHNLFNERTPYLRNTQPYFVNYDSTNYSAIGRFVGISITKRW